MSGVVLVTGGAGFVGSHVVDALVERGRTVRVLDVLHPAAHSARPDYLHPDAEMIEDDIREPDVVTRALDGVTAVCHQAAMVGLGVDFSDVADYVGHNDLGTAVLLRALAATGFAGPLVLASSMVIYGEGRYACAEHGVVRAPARTTEDLDAGRFDPPCPHCGRALDAQSVDEDAPVDPRNVYAATKLHQEHLCAAFARERPAVALTILRYHNVYGPRMPRDTPYAGVASIFRSALAAGHAPRVFEDGDQRRDFVHVTDVARANLTALEDPRPGTYNIASGTPHTVGDLARGLSAAEPDAPAPEITGEYRLGDVRHVFASTDRAARELGFSAQVPFADGVRDFFDAPLRDAAAS